jgi:glycosyltransferase involved in cell wall biosynthesis
MPLTFSVIIATRDRPGLFAEALQSVLTQDYPAFEIIVVNDGSSESALAEYQLIWAYASQTMGPRFSVYHLASRPKGHGPAYSHNQGLAQANGNYICFLDDDDKWTDTGHLSRASQALSNKATVGKQVDLYMTNQKAWINDNPVTKPIWLESLASELAKRGKRSNPDGCFEVEVPDLIATAGFCHMNCLIVRRDLLVEIGGMDESIRWEQDRDIYLRLIDHSQCMLHHPTFVAFHRVPDPSKSLNTTTVLGIIEKRLLQTRVLDKAAIFAKNPLIRAYARQQKAYALKKIAQELAKSQKWNTARYYAAQALGAAPGLKWLGFTGYCLIRSVLQTTNHD